MSPDSVALTLSFSNPRSIVARDIAAKWPTVMERNQKDPAAAITLILLGEALEALIGQTAAYEFLKYESDMAGADVEWRLRAGTASVYRRFLSHLEDFHSVNKDADETRIEGLAPGQALEWGDRLIKLTGIADEQRCRRLRRILPRLYAQGGTGIPGPTEFSVLLVSLGKSPLQAIAALCKIARISPQQAKDLAADAPVAVLEGADKTKAEEARKALAEAGTVVEVR